MACDEKEALNGKTSEYIMMNAHHVENTKIPPYCVHHICYKDQHN